MIKTGLLILTLSIWIFGQVGNQGPAQKSEYRIANIYILLDADTRYLRKLANRMISGDKIDHSAEIACFKDQLLKSRLFENVEHRVSKLPGTEKYDLTLIARYKKNPPVYEIDEVTFKGFKNLDGAKLNDLSNSILGRTRKVDLRYDFPQLETTIVDGLGKVANEAEPEVWIELTLKNNNRLVITVMRRYCCCPQSHMLE